MLVARREAELKALAEELQSRHGATSTIVAADLADPAAVGQIRQAVAELDVEILVNNAGLGDHGAFADSDPAQDERMLAVNVVALTALTREFLPDLITAGRGRILNVASTAAFQPGPFMAVYYASKAYVLSFTEALAEELSGTGVTATALCPGVVPSGFQAAAGIEDTPLVKSPREVAEAAYSGMQRGKRIVIPGVLNQVGAQSVRFAPRRVITKVVKRLHPQD